MAFYEPIDTAPGFPRGESEAQVVSGMQTFDQIAHSGEQWLFIGRIQAQGIEGPLVALGQAFHRPILAYETPEGLRQ